MTFKIVDALGGLGLFLLGMIILTEGLRALAGDAVHRTITRFTKSPATGALTGAGLTALLQSSSVTTVATVGFVSAGLLSFPQALGVMFGANIGTTATGWMVALLGFQIGISGLALPVLLAGVLLRLFGRHRVANAGWAIVGFAIIFIGIEAMQDGMASFEGVITPEDFPSDTYVGRLVLIAIGAGVTLVTQSSSAGVATALAAVSAGAISFPQAAAMVIGMDVGTTSTTAIATIGGSAQTKRTGYAHVVYNLLTAVGAFLLLDPYVFMVDALFEGGAAASPTLALVGFHTTFNGLGVLAVLPLTSAFARLMTRLVPQRSPDLAAPLDASLLSDPLAATLSLLAAVRAIAVELFDSMANALELDRPSAVDAVRARRVDRAIDEARRYADGIEAPDERSQARRLLVASMHAIDHLDRLEERCRHADRIQALRDKGTLQALSETVHYALRASIRSLERESVEPAAPKLLHARDVVRVERQPYRRRVLANVPDTAHSLDRAILQLDSMRWLHRTTYHAWRIVHHLEEANEGRLPDESAETGTLRAEIDREE